MSSFEAAVAVFNYLFQADTDIRSARLRFRHITQAPEESNVIYLANLREAVEGCNFGDLADEMLRDRFIEGCHSDQLRDKLIMTDALTMFKLTEIAEAHDRGLQRKSLLHTRLARMQHQR